MVYKVKCDRTKCDVCGCSYPKEELNSFRLDDGRIVYVCWAGLRLITDKEHWRKTIPHKHKFKCTTCNKEIESDC